MLWFLCFLLPSWRKRFLFFFFLSWTVDKTSDIDQSSCGYFVFLHSVWLVIVFGIEFRRSSFILTNANIGERVINHILWIVSMLRISSNVGSTVDRLIRVEQLTNDILKYDTCANIEYAIMMRLWFDPVSHHILGKRSFCETDTQHFYYRNMISYIIVNVNNSYRLAENWSNEET